MMIFLATYSILILYFSLTICGLRYCPLCSCAGWYSYLCSPQVYAKRLRRLQLAVPEGGEGCEVPGYWEARCVCEVSGHCWSDLINYSSYCQTGHHGQTCSEENKHKQHLQLWDRNTDGKTDKRTLPYWSSTRLVHWSLCLYGIRVPLIDSLHDVSNIWVLNLISSFKCPLCTLTLTFSQGPPLDNDKEMRETDALSLIILELNYSRPFDPETDSVQVSWLLCVEDILLVIAVLLTSG